MRNGSKAMEQHSNELDDQDEGEEEHEDETNRLQLQVLLTNKHLSGRSKQHIS